MQIWKGWGTWEAQHGARRGHLIVEPWTVDAVLANSLSPPTEPGIFLARLEPPLVRVLSWRAVSTYRPIRIQIVQRHGHLRRGHASDQARATAHAAGISLPDGFTYVRAHQVRRRMPPQVKPRRAR